jgi:DNA-binding transcriptional ArsR family regulator
VELELLRALSKELLGNKYRLELGAAIHAQAGGPFSANSLHEETGIKYPRVREDLARLRALEMIRVVDVPGAEVLYKAVPSVYWESCHRLAQEVRAGLGAASRRTPVTRPLHP